MIRELRLLIAQILLGWAFDITPDGIEKISLALFLKDYFKVPKKDKLWDHECKEGCEICDPEVLR